MIKNDLEIARSLTIGNVTIDLREPDVIDAYWIGQREVFRLLSAAWLKVNDSDRIMSPLLVGPPGSGKTTLAYSVAQEFNRPVYLINCTSDMRPEDLLITTGTVFDTAGGIPGQQSRICHDKRGHLHPR